jgi:hypothetical protein
MEIGNQRPTEGAFINSIAKIAIKNQKMMPVIINKMIKIPGTNEKV